ncbi:zf-TFIIB domain-containing protein [Microbacterium enclense]|uniref:zf-TFIIB domain-containing protein n=1 Tax=Microbacterium enclense TaxID=993073 RepID=UPI0037C8678C
MLLPPAPTPTDAAGEARAFEAGITEGFPPRCPRCLHTLQPRSRRSTAVWVCPSCDLSRIS